MNKGRWIAIYDDLKNNWIWSADSVNKCQAWIDLLLRASGEDKTISFDGHPLRIVRGQFLTSVRKLSKEWGWSKDKTLRFLKDLEKEGMIVRDSATLSATLITIVNYDVYQWKMKGKKDTHKDSDKDTHEDTYKDTHKDSDEPQSTYNNNNNKQLTDIGSTEPEEDDDWDNIVWKHG